MQPIRLTPAHRMLASAVVVGVVIVGGASITAAAFAGRLDKVAEMGGAPAAELGPAADVSPSAGASPSPETAPDVVSKILTDDPEKVGGYWTPDRLEDADPMPMPEISIDIVTPAD